MSFERPITAKEAIENIHRKSYLLPAIQREFVWEASQIELLFDSMLRGYPIGSFLFWWVERDNLRQFKFYEFVRDYHQRDNTHNLKANVSGYETVTAILDGQQRLTALYIGLRGSYCYKLPGKRWENDSAFPKRELYLNLLAPSSDYEMEYDFRFLTKQETLRRDENTFWYEVGDILDVKETYELSDFVFANNLTAGEQARFANKTLHRLYNVTHDSPIINYFMEKDESLDKVLNIFIRVNSGGTKLSHSDLLLSIATAQWQEKDAREEITRFVDELNHIGDGFDFNKDFVLKCCLILSDFGDIAFKVDNFNSENMTTIERNWEGITKAIRSAVILVDSFGYHRDTLTSNNALIPIAYYLYRIGMSDNYAISSSFEADRQNILRWLIISLLKRSFSGQPDNVLRPMRQVIANQYQNGFPSEGIADALKASPKTLVFTEAEVDNLLAYEYGKPYTFSTLALLYPSLDFRNKFHIDHIFPKALFTKKHLRSRGIHEEAIDFYLENVNRLGNLQLLEGIPNQEKSDQEFKGWLYRKYPKPFDRQQYMERHYIPDVELNLENFRKFIEGREALLKRRFQMMLGTQ